MKPKAKCKELYYSIVVRNNAVNHSEQHNELWKEVSLVLDLKIQGNQMKLGPSLQNGAWGRKSLQFAGDMYAYTGSCRRENGWKWSRKKKQVQPAEECACQVEGPMVMWEPLKYPSKMALSLCLCPLPYKTLLGKCCTGLRSVKWCYSFFRKVILNACGQGTHQRQKDQVGGNCDSPSAGLRESKPG